MATGIIENTTVIFGLVTDKVGATENDLFAKPGIMLDFGDDIVLYKFYC